MPWVRRAENGYVREWEDDPPPAPAVSPERREILERRARGLRYLAETALTKAWASRHRKAAAVIEKGLKHGDA